MTSAYLRPVQIWERYGTSVTASIVLTVVFNGGTRFKPSDDYHLLKPGSFWIIGDVNVKDVE